VWTTERCELSYANDSCYDQQLENSLFSQEDFRARAKAKQAEILRKPTGPVGKLNEALKELLCFLTQGDNWEETGRHNSWRPCLQKPEKWRKSKNKKE
jgi:hypothetical protein